MKKKLNKKEMQKKNVYMPSFILKLIIRYPICFSSFFSLLLPTCITPIPLSFFNSFNFLMTSTHLTTEIFTCNTRTWRSIQQRIKNTKIKMHVITIFWRDFFFFFCPFLWRRWFVYSCGSVLPLTSLPPDRARDAKTNSFFLFPLCIFAFFFFYGGGVFLFHTFLLFLLTEEEKTDG